VDPSAFGEAFVTMLVIMDPVGNAPVFLALTAGMAPRARRRAALEAVGWAAALTYGFALAGQAVLRYLRVSLESLQIAGGLLLLGVALEMLRGEDPPRGETPNVALVPMATPLLAGPGAIAASMVLARRHATAAGRAGVVAGIGAALVVVGMALLAASGISRVLRPAAVHFLTRVLGLLLSAIAVQLVVDAVRSLAG
jgi:multiple antibiotic resistance protein